MNSSLSRCIPCAPVMPGLAAMLALGLLCDRLTAAAPPVVSNVRASQRAGTQLVDVYYDLADPDSSALTVSIAVSTNGGASYTAGAASFTGHVGVAVAPGSNKKITWNAGVDLPAKLFSGRAPIRVKSQHSTNRCRSGKANVEC